MLHIAVAQSPVRWPPLDNFWLTGLCAAPSFLFLLYRPGKSRRPTLVPQFSSTGRSQGCEASAVLK